MDAKDSTESKLFVASKGDSSTSKYDTITQRLAMAQPIVSRSKFNLDEVLEKPEVASFIPDLQFKSMQSVPLAYAIYEDAGGSSHLGGGGAKEVHVDGIIYYRVSFSVVGVQPLNLFEACQLYCAKCNRAFSYKTLT